MDGPTIPSAQALGLGLDERGLLASRLLPILGPLYFLLELAIIYILYLLVERYTLLRGDWAMLVAVSGPWLAAWHNTGVLLRSMGATT